MSDGGSRGRILVVDDIDSNRYVLGAYLSRAGYEVVEASSGEEALALVKAGGIDLALLDVNLPDMTGYEVCERIKEMPGLVLPVMHLSATAIQIADRSEGLRRGADAYLVEPVDRQELLATIEALLRSSTSQRLTLEFARRLRRLNELTLAVHAAPTVRLLLNAVAAGAAEMSASAVAVIGLPDLTAVSASHAEGTLVRTLTPEQARAATTVEGLADLLTALGVRRESEPMAHRVYDLEPGVETDSVLVVATGSALEDAEATDLLINQLVLAASTALRNLRNYQTKQVIALTLQRTLLPGVIPEIPGLEVAVRYEASAEYTDVGGDFYEAFALDEHRTAIAIGDVVGHSLEAATAMAQLRTAIRAYSLDGHGPAANLHRLNSLLLRFHPEMTATVCLIEFDRRSETIEVVNAGHLPPLMVGPSGPSYLDVSGTMLGVDHLSVVHRRFAFEQGQTLVLVTDGLIERRGETIEVGFGRLLSSCASPISGVEALCDRILEEVGPQGEPHDDIALIVVRRN